MSFCALLYHGLEKTVPKKEMKKEKGTFVCFILHTLGVK